MPTDGLYWYTDPGVIGQRFSRHAGRLPNIIGGVVSEATDRAVDHMRNAVMTRGVERGVPTGGPRIQEGHMYNSIDGDVEIAKSRVRSNFGFINRPPNWTEYQERGTKRTGWGQGIMPMHAFATAQVEFVDALEDEFQSVNLWENF